MHPIRIRKTIDSETLYLPELKPLVGRTVEITISANPDQAPREEFYHLLGQVPESEAGWIERQARLRGWRTDPRFEPYWPAIDQMLTVDFASFRRWDAASEAVDQLEGYDYDAWREQRDYDVKHAHDHLP